MTSLIRPETSTYRLLKCLGEGLSSCVYAAIREDSRKFSKQSVVLKILKNETDVSWLKREFDALSSIRSPHCVGVFGWENLPEGPALVLEEIDGLTLRELAKARELSLEEIDEITAQIQTGLAAVHAANLCHGDLSPSNIMVDRSGLVRLIDFALEPDPQKLVGTPAYMAPELWEGERRSFASDLFSLGVVRRELGATNLFLGSLCDENPHQRAFLELSSCDSIKNQLGQLVSKTLDEQIQGRFKTQILHEQSRQLIQRWCGTRVAVAIMLSIVMIPAFSSDKAVQTAELEVRSHRWLEVFIDGKNLGYAPVKLAGIAAGEHELKWRSAKGFGARKIHFAPREVKRLRSEDLGL